MPTEQPLTLGVKTETRMTAVISNPANRNKNLGQSCPHSAEGGSIYCIYSKLKLNLGLSGISSRTRLGPTMWRCYIWSNFWNVVCSSSSFVAHCGSTVTRDSGQVTQNIWMQLIQSHLRSQVFANLEQKVVLNFNQRYESYLFERRLRDPFW